MLPAVSGQVGSARDEITINKDRITINLYLVAGLRQLSAGEIITQVHSDQVEIIMGASQLLAAKTRSNKVVVCLVGKTRSKDSV